MNKKYLLCVAALASMAVSAPAMADQIVLGAGDVGTAFTLNYDGYSDGNNVDGLTGSTTFTLTGIAGNYYTFDYMVTNTSSAPVTGSRISGFAFNTDPTINDASSSGSFGFTTLNSNYPNGIGTVDVCFKDASTGSCAGGGSGGLDLGQTGTGSFTLGFSQPVSELTLSDFYVRYQSIEGVAGVTSANGSGTMTSTSTSSGGTSVPEPGMLVLFGFGLAGIALSRKRFAYSSRRARPAVA